MDGHSTHAEKVTSVKTILIRVAIPELTNKCVLLRVMFFARSNSWIFTCHTRNVGEQTRSIWLEKDKANLGQSVSKLITHDPAVTWNPLRIEMRPLSIKELINRWQLRTYPLIEINSHSKFHEFQIQIARSHRWDHGPQNRKNAISDMAFIDCLQWCNVHSLNPRIAGIGPKARLIPNAYPLFAIFWVSESGGLPYHKHFRFAKGLVNLLAKKMYQQHGWNLEMCELLNAVSHENGFGAVFLSRNHLERFFPTCYSNGFEQFFPDELKKLLETPANGALWLPTS
ncbi:hypothetical protein TNCV_4935821 [Trichonephila clavipes]|nr:hypothetical protein TNCV_4935821 [Trichonephila clavipes]